MLKQIINTTRSLIGAIIAPPYCSYCKIFLTTRSILCNECCLRIRPLVTTTIAVTKTCNVKVYALGAYQEPLQSLIRAKHHGDRLASQELAELFCAQYPIKEIPCDYWVPIPLHWTRYAWRGFNQAAEMAHVFSTATGKPVLPVLKRTKRTILQAMLSPVQRVQNLQQAFVLQNKLIDNVHGKHIVLVDDLMTTGATLQEAARMLRPLNPASISAVVACRVV